MFNFLIFFILNCLINTVMEKKQFYKTYTLKKEGLTVLIRPQSSSSVLQGWSSARHQGAGGEQETAAAGEGTFSFVGVLSKNALATCTPTTQVSSRYILPYFDFFTPQTSFHRNVSLTTAPT